MDIPGLDTLYSVLKRNIDRRNDVLAQRKELAKELMDNCRKWASELLKTFNEAVMRWQGPGGREAAEREIVQLQEDFLKLDYWSLKSDSPILSFLHQDRQFAAFADSCADFYMSALEVKRIAFGSIKGSSGQYVNANDVGVKSMVEHWRAEVERMLSKVTTQYHKIRTIRSK